MENDKILSIISVALNIDKGKLSLDSTADTIDEWDSIGHLSVLVALDKAFDGKLAEINDMANANSVNKIFQVLKNNSFI